ncbi:putative Peptidoglycan-binding domain 1 protein [Candidatus Terasakiella magnetica]|nr:putative Peptidoglycan-binding domain 1 protein [Candidatus Terasakiella magnetica]
MRQRCLALCAIAMGSAITLAGGLAWADPQQSAIAAQPKTTVSRAISNFSEALTCVDGLLVRYGVSGIALANGGILDSTGKVAAGTNEMVVTAISRMTRQSRALTFIDYDTTSGDLARITAEVRAGRRAAILAAYYLRGAITSVDENVLQSSVGGRGALSRKDTIVDPDGIGKKGLIDTFEIADSKNQLVTVMSLDVNLANSHTRQVIAEANSSNTIAVVQAGKSDESGGKISKMGINFTISTNEAEGKGAAVRALTELALIESIGRLTSIPYWECLGHERTEPTYRTWARELFDDQSEQSRMDFVLRGLHRSGYVPEIAGASAHLAPTISRYQADHDLVPTGQVDFDLYYSLMAQDPGESPRAAANHRRLSVEVAATDGGASFKKGQGVSLILTAPVRASAYCFMREADDVLIRVFPNRFQPSPHLTNASSVTVPPQEGRSFAMVLDKAPGRTIFTCFSLPVSEDDLGAALGPDLKPLDFDEQEIENRLSRLSSQPVERISATINVP